MNKLEKKIKSKKAKVGIIGLGYVGLELLSAIGQKNFTVIGFDKNEEKINLLKKGISPINTVSSNSIKKSKAEYTNIKNYNQISGIDIIIICLPTPLKKNNTPDNSYLINCLNGIYEYLRKDQLLVIESTVYPGCTENIFVKKIKKKFKIGKNFFIGFSPERVSPAKKISLNYNEIEKLVSGKTLKCLKVTKQFYKKIFQKVYECKNIEIAEFTKVYENAYRSVNIGFVNQMKIISNKLGINIYNVIEAASTKPFGFIPFLPSPGVGGHCIPVDPSFISYVAKSKKLKSTFIDNAQTVNLEVTNWTLKKIRQKLKPKKKIIILGLGYKKDVDDLRESASIKIFKGLNKKYKIAFYDPYIKKINISNKQYHCIEKFKYNNLIKFDGVVLATDHSTFKYNKILKFSKLIFDTRTKFGRCELKKVIHC